MKQASVADLVMPASGTSVSTGVSTARLTSEQWTSFCAARLMALRPTSDKAAMREIARDMSLTMAYFDPEMAAEMEHEGGMLDD